MPDAGAIMANEQDPDFIIARVFDAPRQTVWQAMTEAERMKQWWGPTGYKVTTATMDFRPGGVFHCGMTSIEGHKLWGRFVYREIADGERVVFLNAFSNAGGEVKRHPIVPTWPLETLTTVTFTGAGEGKTEVAVYCTPHDANPLERQTFTASVGAVRLAWTGTFDQLARYLAKG
jgi:uncharacterized protein YndB with AHSA1/START domain